MSRSLRFSSSLSQEESVRTTNHALRQWGIIMAHLLRQPAQRPNPNLPHHHSWEWVPITAHLLRQPAQRLNPNLPHHSWASARTTADQAQRPRPNHRPHQARRPKPNHRAHRLPHRAGSNKRCHQQSHLGRRSIRRASSTSGKEDLRPYINHGISSSVCR